VPAEQREQLLFEGGTTALVNVRDGRAGAAKGVGCGNGAERVVEIKAGKSCGRTGDERIGW